jgi:hypothetical protein
MCIIYSKYYFKLENCNLKKKLQSKIQKIKQHIYNY